MTKLKALRAKIGLPVIIAIILLIATAGIVVAATVQTRTVHLNVTPSTYDISVLPTGSETRDIVAGSTTGITYAITNDGNSPASVSTAVVAYDGITTDVVPVIELLPQQTGNITITFHAASDASSGDVTITFTSTGV